MHEHTILVVNPGSTSTKVAVAEGESLVRRETFRHSSEELKQMPRIWDQFQLRTATLKAWVEQNLSRCDAVITLGGLLRPLAGGVYKVNQAMINDARANLQGEHASNLGCALAFELAQLFSCQAFVGDPVSVDEFEPLSYYSGHPLIKRRALSHSLNIHAAARRAAHDRGTQLGNASFIIAHLGGGISIAPVKSGKIVDVNDAASDGPFSPERTGGMPLQQFISLMVSRQYNELQLRKLVMGEGGLVAYLGTNSVIEVEKRVNEGDAAATEVFQAMAYQIAKEIGAMSTVLSGKVDAIVLTGGAASSTMLTGWIQERVEFIAPVMIYPGEDEMQALASAAFRVLSGEEQLLEY